MAALTLQICLNANRSVCKIFKFKTESSAKNNWKKLVKLAKAKLLIKKKPQKLFLVQTGEEITINNINQLICPQYAQNFKTNLKIAVSVGEAYVGKIIDTKTIHTKQICLLRCLISASTVHTDAEKQLQACQRLKGMKLVIGQPDLHAGKGYPIGVSLISEKYVYPFLIGTDIGCGMALIQTDISTNNVNDQKMNRWVNDIKLDNPWVNDLKMNDETQNKQDFMKQILGNKLNDWPKNKNEAGINVESVIKNGVNIHAFDQSLGTIGHGNHFAELQCIEQIIDKQLFQELGLNEDKLFLMVHSGSRGFGAAILDNYLKTHKAQTPLDVTSEDFKSYMVLHQNALKWARKNRMIIAQRFLQCMGSGSTYDFDHCICHIDIFHNYLCAKDKDCFLDAQREIHNRMNATFEKSEMKIESVKMSKSDRKFPSKCLDILDELITTFETELEMSMEQKELWYVHRKGAAPNDNGFVVIPGSRGTYSYIVKPNTTQGSYSGYSLAHGAGRKLTRSKAVKSLQKKYGNVNQLKKTGLGSFVICEDKSLMYEEAPESYKDIGNVIQDLVNHNMVTVVAILKPLITYKNRGKEYSSFKGSKRNRHSRNPLIDYDD